MKWFKISAVIITFFLLNACKKFLDRPPLDTITDKEMSFTANEMKLYSNQFYPALPGWAPGEFSGGVFWYDLGTDNLIPGVYNQNAQLSGTLTVPSSGGGWDWGNVRAVNYFLANYQVTQEPPANINTYIGEMYFWRAWFYFSLLRQFGDLPWYNQPLQVNDSVMLYAPRLKRNVIADSILADLDRAVSLLAEPGKAEPQRINQGAALAFKSRVALYEGSWEKYHDGTPFGVPDAHPETYFLASVQAAETLMAKGFYSITSISSDPDFGYWRLFNQQDLSGNNEIILWRKYDKALGLFHFAQNLLAYEGTNTGISKQFVDSYLAIDGEPIAISPLYGGDDSISQAVKNRDPRLKQTIFVRGYPRIILKGDTTAKFTEPDINLPGGMKNTTGYQLFKGVAPDDADQTGSATASIVMRYAEVLLNYAEAEAELGEATQEVLDKSVNVLRDRVGMPHLSIAVGFTDPNWEFPSLSPLINEIRRERKVELGLEGFRKDDLMRWAGASLLKRPMLGAKFSQFEGKPFNPPLGDIPVSNDGYIAPLKNTPAADGWGFNPDRDYLMPLPSNELVLNKNLQQNPGW